MLSDMYVKEAAVDVIRHAIMYVKDTAVDVIRHVCKGDSCRCYQTCV